MVRVNFIHPFILKEGFCEMSFARRFKTPDGIARRVPGVLVLPILTYFKYCPFFLDMLNCRSPSGDQLIFISRNGEGACHLSIFLW